MEFETKMPCSLRTVIVADHGPEFLKQSPGTRVDLDGGSKHNRQTQGSSGLVKSLWTTVAEGAVEYCRIMYDVLPEEYMVQVIASDSESFKLNEFQKEHQNISQILKGFAIVGPPRQTADNGGQNESSVFPGLQDGITSLVESLFPLGDFAGNSNMKQYGRLILLTSLSGNHETKPIIAKVSEIQDRIDSQRNCHIELVIVNVSSISDKITRDSRDVSSVLTVSTMSFKPAQLPIKMSLLTRKHFHLRSTSITGIPMKEEQHAGSSANYDVEIIHAAEVHHETYWFCSNAETQSGNIPSSSSSKKDIMSKNVVTLKWCTPKVSTNNELLQCVGAYRCTPAEVNSRPAACLISFLQQGRTVLLEQPKRSGTKVLSHMLASHGGDVYIHVLATGRSPVEEPSSISEGCGGRVTDYRIGDFGKFMKENRLAPFTVSKNSTEETPMNKALSRLERSTRHWPFTIGDTLIFNMSTQLEPLLSHLIKAKLSEDEVQECKKVIFKLQSMESRNDTLPLPIISIRGKGSKREEQYRQLWLELEAFVKLAAATSVGHCRVHECLLGVQDVQQSSQIGSASSSNSTALRSKDPRQEQQQNVADIAWKELNEYSKMTEHEKKIADQGPSDPRKRKLTEEKDINASKKKSILPKTFKAGSSSFKSLFGENTNLLSMWTSQMKHNTDRLHKEFEGSKNAIDGKTELYAELNKELNVTSLNTASVKEWV